MKSLAKRKKKKKPSKPSLAELKGTAWEWYSKYIRVRDSIRTTGTPDRCTCCTCGKEYPAFGIGCIQAGHFIPGRHNSVIFNDKNVHGQCYVCNYRLKGNWSKYYKFMLDTYGQETIDTLRKEDNYIHPFTRDELEAVIEKCRLFVEANR